MHRSRPLLSSALLSSALALGALGGALHTSQSAASAPAIRMLPPSGPPSRRQHAARKTTRHYSGQRISVAEGKRRAAKRRNRQRHKARVRA